MGNGTVIAGSIAQSRGGRRQGGGQPGQQAGEMADGAGWIHSGLYCCLVCGARWGGASRSLAGHRRTTAACPGC